MFRVAAPYRQRPSAVPLNLPTTSNEPFPIAFKRVPVVPVQRRTGFRIFGSLHSASDYSGDLFSNGRVGHEQRRRVWWRERAAGVGVLGDGSLKCEGREGTGPHDGVEELVGHRSTGQQELIQECGRQFGFWCVRRRRPAAISGDLRGLPREESDFYHGLPLLVPQRVQRIVKDSKVLEVTVYAGSRRLKRCDRDQCIALYREQLEETTGG